MPEVHGGSSTGGAVGILGGTFDPVHLAHLALAHAALECLSLDRVLWIPAGQPPHRDCPGGTATHRLAMVQAAIAGEPRFELDASEVGSDAPSYSVHTLERLRCRFGDTVPLVLLMGADAFHGLERWYRWQELFALAHIAVATRPGFPLQDFTPTLAREYDRRRASHTGFAATPAGAIVTFELFAGTVSATEVRTELAAGATDDRLRQLLPKPVLDYIRQHKLYCP